MKRRDFLKITAITTAGSMIPISLKAAQKAHIVIIGGGFSGATCAKYLKLWGGRSIDVTIIEKNPLYTSPILSNLVLNNIKNINSLKFSYTGLINYGIKILNTTAINFDTDKRVIYTENGKKIRYDKLVLAPGIDFKFPNKYDINKIPHAWIAGKQTLILKKQIDSLRDGDTFIMSIPKKPYRCPPGPYERACVVADYLRKKRVKVNVVVMDENQDIIVEKKAFGSKFKEYGIDYRPSCKIINVDDNKMEVTYSQFGYMESIKGNVINIIPNQKAAKPIFLAGVNDGDFAPVDTKSYESLIKKDIYIIGDSHKSSQPKAGHIGNGEGKICADAILRNLNGYPVFDNPKTNSACYSPVSDNEATWLTAIYRYDPTTKDMKIIKGYPKSGMPSKKNFVDMFYWAGNLFSDTFS